MPGYLNSRGMGNPSRAATGLGEPEDEPPSFVHVWITRAPMNGLGQLPQKFAMPFNEKVQACFEESVARGHFGSPLLYRASQS